MTVAIFVVVPGEARRRRERETDRRRREKTRAHALLPTSPTILWHLSPLPGNKLHEVVIEGNSSLSIKDGRMGIAIKVRGDHLRDNFKDEYSRARISRNPDFRLSDHCHSLVWHTGQRPFVLVTGCNQGRWDLDYTTTGGCSVIKSACYISASICVWIPRTHERLGR